MKQFVLLFLLVFSTSYGFSQSSINVACNYDAVGDAHILATNYLPFPAYVSVDLSFIENAAFNESLPFIKRLEPGETELFVVRRELNMPSPRLGLDFKWYPANPKPEIDSKFPYLIPAGKGSTVKVFYPSEKEGQVFGLRPEDAIAFWLPLNDTVYASRLGVVAGGVNEFINTVSQKEKGKRGQNVVRVMFKDGLVGEYRNLSLNKIFVGNGETVIPGQPLGIAEKGADGESFVVFSVFYSSFSSDRMEYVRPMFYTGEKEPKVVTPPLEYKVSVPDELIGAEMSKKEKKQFLGSKK